jgi:uncharacterized protein (DUF1810 family)
MTASGLDRFKRAQDASGAGFAVALAEMQAGRKRSHWIWYVFPQLGGLGQSTMSRTYALRDPDEALAYAHDPVLLDRLVTITAAVAARLGAGIPLTTLMGGEVDALKLVSSMTLFSWVAGKLPGTDGQSAKLMPLTAEILAAAAAQGFAPCAHTLRALAARAP